MLYNFLLIGKDNHDSKRIKEELERNRLYNVSSIDQAELALDQIRHRQIDCVVFNLETFSQDKISFASHLRYCGYTFPIIFFANNVEKIALTKLSRIPKTVIIEKPYESKDIWGIAEKMVQGKSVYQKVHRRYYTDQKAQIVHSTIGTKLSGRIFNMSQGGAYLEVEQGELKLGDVVRVSIELNKLSKSHIVDAKVVWASKQGFWQGKPAVGLMFLKSGEVYRNLIDKI